MCHCTVTWKKRTCVLTRHRDEAGGQSAPSSEPDAFAMGKGWQWCLQSVSLIFEGESRNGGLTLNFRHRLCRISEVDLDEFHCRPLLQLFIIWYVCLLGTHYKHLTLISKYVHSLMLTCLLSRTLCLRCINGTCSGFVVGLNIIRHSGSLQRSLRGIYCMSFIFLYAHGIKVFSASWHFSRCRWRNILPAKILFSCIGHKVLLLCKVKKSM